VTAEISLADVRGRAQLVMVLAKLYALLARMAAVVSARAVRYSVFETIKRDDGVTVMIMPDHVVKCIPEFAAFCAKHQTTLDVLTAAYKAAQEEASQALLEQRCPTLVCALKLSVKTDRYRVAAGPLGYSCTPSTEQVSYSCIACGGHTLELNLYNLYSFIYIYR